jgi:YVTN family beta-propeller protein
MNGGTMKRLILLLFCLLAISYSQWLETTIELPITSIPMSMVANPAGTKLYVANVNSDSSCIYIIDAISNTLLGRIPCGESPGSLCFNTEANKLYVPIPDGTITIIDATADSVIRNLSVGRYPGCLTYYAAGNRIYCSSYDDQTIAVIDGETDTIMRRIALPFATGWLTLNAAENKLYATLPTGLAVIDCSTDTIAALIELPEGPSSCCLDPLQSRLYCALYLSSVLAVVDCAADTVFSTTIPVGTWPCTICYSPCVDKVYCGAYAGSNVTILDCASNSVLATISFPSIPWGMCADPVSGNVYCTSRETRQTLILDGTGDSVLAVVEVGELPGTAYWSAGRHRAYIANENGHSISVLRDSPTVVEEIPNTGVQTKNPCPTIVRRALNLGGQLTTNSSKTRIWLYDTEGRKALELYPGSNDVQNLSPGVYFVKKGNGQLISKIIVLK